MSDEENKIKRDKENNTDTKREETTPPPKPEPPKLAKVREFSEKYEEIVVIKKDK